METIVVEEPRTFINKVRDWYQTKVVDTGISDDMNKNIDRNAEILKKTIKVAGTIATAVLLICPADGPVGEICTALATPALVKLVDVVTDFRKKVSKTIKNALETEVLKVDKKGEVDTYHLVNKPEEFLSDVKNVSNKANEFVETYNHSTKTL